MFGDYKIEPSADARLMAKGIGDCRRALIAEGFSPEEAFVILMAAMEQAKTQ